MNIRTNPNLSPKHMIVLILKTVTIGQHLKKIQQPQANHVDLAWKQSFKSQQADAVGTPLHQQLFVI